MMKWHLAVLVSFLVVQLPNLLGQDSINPLNKKIDSISVQFNSVKGQDKWIIEEVFEGKEEGYFVDLAAFDGRRLSNTYALERSLKWTGICIEPNPEYLPKLKKYRKCNIETACIDGEVHEIEFFFAYKTGGGIIDDDTDNCMEFRGEKITNARESGGTMLLQTKNLEQILDEHNAPAVIDYLSFDVEGSETRILRNFPFDRYTFLSMTIERPTQELHDLLLSNGYIFVTNVFVNLSLTKT